jgi:hypothetical protein
VPDRCPNVLVTFEVEPFELPTALREKDVHKRDAGVPLAVVMRPPASGTSKTYEQARHVFEALEARAVSQPELDDWAAEVAESLVAK